MTNEEANALVDTVLEMDAQADRSVALIKIKECLKACYDSMADLQATADALTERNNVLTDRNQELFLRVGGDTAPAPASEVEEPSDILTDVDKLFS